MTTLSELIASLLRDGDEWRIAVGDDWLQGRTVYGGLAAALCVAYVIARSIYPVMYIANVDKARSSVWFVGFAASAALMMLPLFS